MSRPRDQRGLLPDGTLRRLIWIIPLGMLGNLTYTLLATDREALAATAEFHAPWLLLAVILAILPLVFNALRVWRWGRLLSPGFRARDAAYTVLSAEVGAAVTPSAIGGAPVKVAALARCGLGTSGGVTLTALGTIEEAVAVAIGIPIAILATGMVPQIAAVLRRASDATFPGQGFIVLAVVALLIAVGVWLLLRGTRGRRRRARVRRWWRELRNHVALVRRYGLRTFVINVALAGVQWAARLSIVAALTAGLGAPIEPARAAVLQWICFSGMTLTPTPGAVGGAEAAFLLVFARELPGELVPLALASWRLVTFYGLNVLALLLLMMGALWGRRRAEGRRAEYAR
ncbi:flippase-like domain-containing protein [bacterium]|nr:flippase-like domain-containing protein [bacterium]